MSDRRSRDAETLRRLERVRDRMRGVIENLEAALRDAQMTFAELETELYLLRPKMPPRVKSVDVEAMWDRARGRAPSPLPPQSGPMLGDKKAAGE